MAAMAIHGASPSQVPQLVLRFEAIGLKGHGTPFGVVVDIDQEGLDRWRKTRWQKNPWPAEWVLG